MARGKKATPETIYKVMISWIYTRNYNETARNLGMAVSSVRDIVEDNKDNDEFAKLRIQKEDEFADKATEIIDKGLVLLKRRMDRAIEEEETLDDLIDEIDSMPDDEMSYQKKTATINKIKSMQLHNLKDITTAIGTLYDKRALSRGETTQNIDFATNSETLGKLFEIAGYQKKDDDTE
jgi:hypothetical protein